MTTKIQLLGQELTIDGIYRLNEHYLPAPAGSIDEVAAIKADRADGNSSVEATLSIAEHDKMLAVKKAFRSAVGRKGRRFMAEVGGHVIQITGVSCCRDADGYRELNVLFNPVVWNNDYTCRPATLADHEAA